MSGRPVTESARIVIRTDDGNRVEINSKGSAAHAIATAFRLLSEPRRLVLIEALRQINAELAAKAGSAT